MSTFGVALRELMAKPVVERHGWAPGKASYKNKHRYVGFQEEQSLLVETVAEMFPDGGWMEIDWEENVKRLMAKKNLTREEAEQVENNVLDTKMNFKVGDPVQYYHLGERFGFIESLPRNGSVRVQPVGPKHAKELPRVLTLDWRYIKAVDHEYLKEDTIMELKQKSSEVKAKQATQAALNLKPIKGQAPTTKPVKAVKADKPVKAVKSSPRASTGEQTWKFVKVGEATGQRALILSVLKGDCGGKATRAELGKALAKKLETSQDVNTVLSLKKKYLVDNGCVTIS